MDHLGIDHTTARQAILTGDPDRVPSISSRLGGGRELTARRGFLCHEVDCDGHRILVVATGIGAPATAIVVEELAELGVKTMVRIGTCGALQPEIKPGDLVVSTGAVREDGASRQYIDLSFPAVPDLGLTWALAQEIQKCATTLHLGPTHCKDSYYLERPGKQLLPGRVAEHWDALRRAGVLATEMEAAVLFVLGSLRRLRAAAVLINVGKVTDQCRFDAALDTATTATRTVFQAPDHSDPPLPATQTAGENVSYLDRK